MTPVSADEAEGLQRLAHLRDQVFECDQEIVREIGLRSTLIREIDELKTRLGFPTHDPERDGAVVKRAVGLATDQGVDVVLVEDLMWRIMGQRYRVLSIGGEGVPAETEGGA